MYEFLGRMEAAELISIEHRNDFPAVSDHRRSGSIRITLTEKAKTILGIEKSS
jgi:hypothetical protein